MIDNQAAHYDSFYSDANELAAVLHRESFDVIFIRGMSWYHYELNGINAKGVDVPASTARLFEYLKKGGLFVLQIQTDFSGRKPVDGVHQNRLGEYTRLFDRFGDIVHISNWKGRILESESDAEKSGGNIIIATRKSLQ
jgi:hypothetical protein